MSKDHYSIYIGNDLIGIASMINDDMPWRKGKFEPSHLFDKYRGLFDLERELSKSKHLQEWEKLSEAIDKLGLKMVSSNGEVILPSLGAPPGDDYVSKGFAFFHIRGNEVRWRPT